MIKKWKRPNWRNPYEYPNMNDASLYQWYWQFLRRREDYQQYFYRSDCECEETIENNYDKTLIKPNHPIFIGEIRECSLKFNTTCTPNPNIDLPPNFYYYGSGIKIPMTFNILGNSISDDQILNATYYQSELPIIFNLEQPIPQQLAKAKKTLEAHQKTHLEKSKPPQVRRHINQWIDYLRALDARHENETYEEIGLIINSSDTTEQGLEDRVFDIGSQKLKREGQLLCDSATQVQFNFQF